MITKKLFVKFIKLVQSYNNNFDKLYELKVDLVNSFLFEDFGILSDLYLDSNYTEEGKDWINWWLFEKPIDNEDHAFDEEGNPIKLETIEELYEFVKQYEI